MRVLLLVLVVAGCASDPVVVTRPAMAQPLVCPTAPPPVPIPPPPRSFETVVEFGRLTDLRREETVKALEQCRKSLESLKRWVAEWGPKLAR